MPSGNDPSVPAKSQSRTIQQENVPDQAGATCAPQTSDASTDETLDRTAQVPHSPKRDHETKYRCRERREWIKLTVEIVTLLLVGWYAVTNRLMYGQMVAANGHSKHAAEAAQEAAKAATKQAAISQTALELSERPWVLARHEIQSSLTFLENGGAVLVLYETLQNSGGSTAINVDSWADLVPLGPNGSWKSALARQSEYCDQHRRWRDELKSSRTGFILFPKQESVKSIGMGLLPEDVAKAVAASTDSQKKIGFVVVGCVWYRTLFEPKSVPAHQTRFGYLLGKPLGPPEATFAVLQSGIPMGTQPMVEPKGTPEGLHLVPSGLGDSAD